MPDTLDILIRVVADAAGIDLTNEKLAEAKARLSALGEAGDASLGQVAARTGAAAGRFADLETTTSRASFRMAQNLESVALSVLGIDSPLLRIINRIQYLQFMAERTGMSLQQMFSKFGAGIAGVAGATLVVNEAIKLAKEADEAYAAAGLQARGFWANLAAGYGLVEDLKPVEVKVDFKAAGVEKILQQFEAIERRANELTQRLSARERVEKEFRPKFESLETERASRLQPLEDKRAEAVRRYEEALQAVNRAQADLDALATRQAEGWTVDMTSAREQLAKATEDAARARQQLKEVSGTMASVVSEFEARRAELTRQAMRALEEKFFEIEAERASVARYRGRHEEAEDIEEAIRRAREEGRRTGVTPVPGSLRWEQITAAIARERELAAQGAQQAAEGRQIEKENRRREAEQQRRDAMATAEANARAAKARLEAAERVMRDESATVEQRQQAAKQAAEAFEQQIAALTEKARLEAQDKTGPQIRLLATTLAIEINQLREKLAEALRSVAAALPPGTKPAALPGGPVTAEQIAQQITPTKSAPPPQRPAPSKVIPAPSTLISPEATPEQLASRGIIVSAPAPAAPAAPTPAAPPTAAPAGVVVDTTPLAQATKQANAEIAAKIAQAAAAIAATNAVVIAELEKLKTQQRDIESRLKANR